MHESIAFQGSFSGEAKYLPIARMAHMVNYVIPLGQNSRKQHTTQVNPPTSKTVTYENLNLSFALNGLLEVL